MEAERGMVGGTCDGVAATRDHGGVVRPSQLIASVGRTEGVWSEGSGTARVADGAYPPAEGGDDERAC